MRASDFLREFLDTNGDSGRDDPDSFPLTEFADIIEQYLGRGYTRQDREKPEQVSVKFEPKDKSRNGAMLYSVVGRQGEYPTVNIHLLDYEQGFGRGRKAGVAIPKTRDNALRLAELIFNAQLNEFAPDGLNGDDDDEGFSPEIAKMAQEDGFTKGVSLADGATLERAMKINYWHTQHDGMYKQYFAKGFKAGRMNKVKHDNKQYNLNLKLMKDGSIRHGEQGVAETQVNEFLDDRDGDDGEGISQIVTITDRLLKQGYKVDLAVIGAMGRVYRADLEQTGFTPNGALAIKRKTKHFLRPFNIDDDDKYDFELVGPKHYKIVDTFTRADNLTESTFRDHEEQLRDFIHWCVKKLKIKQELPQIRFQDAKEGPDQHRTGYYDDAEDIMWIYTGNRNMIDIMRTVAHELTHRKQHEDRRVHGDQSYPGSPIEQEADAVAGYLMKLYGKEHPEIIE